MRTLMLAGAAALTLAAMPSALSAQAADQPTPQTANEANAQAQPAPTTTTRIPGAAPGQPDTVVTDHPGNVTAPPPQAYNKTYPVCSRTVQDSCQNPGEGGAPRRSRG